MRMAELTREQVLDALENGWGTYVERYYALSPAAQSAFLAKQGYARLADLLTHVIAWWEEGAPAVERLLHDPAYRSPDHDVDAFNDQAVASFRDLDETAVQQRFEQARLALRDLVAGLPDSAFRDRQIADRLHIEVIGHMGEHGIQPQSVH
jgi:hypothetical protein